MADVFDIKIYNFDMSRIKGKNTKPEMLVRKFLHSRGFRYKLHVKKLPGKPDIVLPKYRSLIFVHGCFWHAHKSCKLNRLPKNNQEYWIPKIQGNVLRDKIHKRKLKKEGWAVLNIWECQLKPKKKEKYLHSLVKQIKGL